MRREGRDNQARRVLCDVPALPERCTEEAVRLRERAKCRGRQRAQHQQQRIWVESVEHPRALAFIRAYFAFG